MSGQSWKISQWIYFIKEAAILEEIPSTLAAVPEIEKALNIAANLTPEELEEVERRETWLRDRRGEITFAEEKGRIKEAIALTTRQLNKRFGEVPESIKSQLENLSLEDLENLNSEVIFDLNTLEDLANWLANREVS